MKCPVPPPAPSPWHRHGITWFSRWRPYPVASTSSTYLEGMLRQLCLIREKSPDVQPQQTRQPRMGPRPALG
jgi:hypothetical protein